MSETQETVAAWMYATFPGSDPASPRKAIRAMEEMAELCLAAGASTSEIHGAINRVVNASDAWHDAEGRDPRPDEVPAEAADVLIVLYGLAALRGFDLHSEVDRKMAINRARRWKANGDGTGYHLKAGEEGGA